MNMDQVDAVRASIKREREAVDAEREMAKRLGEELEKRLAEARLVEARVLNLQRTQAEEAKKFEDLRRSAAGDDRSMEAVKREMERKEASLNERVKAAEDAMAEREKRMGEAMASIEALRTEMDAKTNELEEKARQLASKESEFLQKEGRLVNREKELDSRHAEMAATTKQVRDFEEESRRLAELEKGLRNREALLEKSHKEITQIQAGIRASEEELAKGKPGTTGKEPEEVIPFDDRMKELERKLKDYEEQVESARDALTVVDNFIANMPADIVNGFVTSDNFLRYEAAFKRLVRRGST
jgi:chromosome segregation ATPase